jgi:hypothetical protein
MSNTVLRGEAFSPAHGEQSRLAPIATADPGGVAMVREAVVGSLAEVMDLLQTQPDAKEIQVERVKFLH